MVDALDTYSHERFIEDGIMEWPDNPFDNSPDKVTILRPKTGTIHISKWMMIGYLPTIKVMSILTLSYIDEKEDSQQLWTYNKENGEIGFDNPPYQHQFLLRKYRPDLQ